MTPKSVQKLIIFMIPTFYSPLPFGNLSFDNAFNMQYRAFQSRSHSELHGNLRTLILEEGAQKMERIHWMIYGLMMVSMVGCGADSLQSTLNQERDRQRTNSSMLARDYRTVAGTYLTMPSKDSSDFYVVARFNLTSVQRDGSLIPQPSLSGSFRVIDKQVLASKRLSSPGLAAFAQCKGIEEPQECGYVFAFSSGVYDEASKVLAVHIQGYGVSGADVSCTKVSDQELDCHWEPASGGAGAFDFVIKKTG